MNRLLIGNIVTLFGSSLNAISGLIKDKRKTIIIQIVIFSIFALGNLILGGISGFISNAISILRNIVCLRFNFTWVFKLAFLASQGVMTLVFSTEGIAAILPFIAVAVYVLVLDTKNPIIFKASISLSQVFWLLYDFTISNYTGVIFDVVSLITNCIALYQLIKGESHTG